MSVINLWDNSWHIEKDTERPNDIDSFGREPRDLIKTDSDVDALINLSSKTIGELLLSEKESVIIFPNSFIEGNDELKKQRIFQVDARSGKLVIYTNNVVGFIGYGETDVRIHSRFSRHSEVNDYLLYYMLERVLSINFFNMPTSASNNESIFDLLLFFFPKLLKGALSQGLFKKYVSHEYNDANLRGVIDMNRHIKRNIPTNGRIAYQTREFSYDNPMTQLVRHTIEYIRRKPFGKAVLHNDTDTDAYVKQIIQATPTFIAQHLQSVINDNLRPVIHPYYTEYGPLQKLCLSILRHDKLGFDQSHNENKIHGILIDVAWLWEKYIASVLNNTTGLRHYTRNTPFDLFSKGKNQKIIPDYFDEDKHLVADAKYIPLNKYNHLDAERASAVYYKTIMYMYRFRSQRGFLFHPCLNDNQDFVFCDNEIMGGAGGHLYELGLVVPSVDENLTPTIRYSQFKKEMAKRETAFVNKVVELST